ncbi:MAG: hypothetical protein Q4F21_08465, partial [Lachnospiraceae bacterium]|nr:hypothetical protein [Lachnospiraceae bacterium]
ESAESREEEPAGSRTVEKSKELVSFFARLMNRKAQEIGCSQTHFITPNGLDASERQKDENGREREYVHSTTPEELALIMRYCLSGSKKSSEFVTVTRTKEAVFTDASGKRSFSCRNHNRYLDMKEGAIAGKTGFTGKAGYCYVGAVNQNGIYLIAVLLACGWPPSKNLKWKDMDTLIDYGLENYTCTRIEQVRKQKFCYRASAVFSSEKNRKKAAAKEAKVGWVLAEIAFEPFELLLKKDETITEYWYLDAKGGKKGEKTGEYRILAGNRLCRAFPVRIVKADSL